MTKLNVTNDDFAKALGKGKNVPSTFYRWGTVKAINSDGSFAVRLDGATTDTDCISGCIAAAGDRVLVLIRNGHCVAVSRTGNHLGVNPISSPSDDTIENWAKLGNGMAWYDTLGCLTDQPSQYGFLFNSVYGSDVFQLWHTQAGGAVCQRGGNSAGWSGSWKRMIDQTILDKIVGTGYSLSTTVTKGSAYTSASGSAYLVGNQLRCYFTAVRTNALSAGNITNETVCTFKIAHGGKIINFYNVAFTSGTSGPVCSFSTTGPSNDGSNVTFGVTLASLGNNLGAGGTINSYFVAPVSIDPSKF